MARTVNVARHRAKRRVILRAAAQLFANQGYPATSTGQICAAAGISSGQLFHYFPSKRALFAALMSGEDLDEDDLQSALAQAYATNDPVEGVLGFVDHLAAGIAGPATPGLVVEAMLQAARDPELAALMADGSDVEQNHLTALLHRAARAGVIDATLDVDAGAAWIMTLISSLYLHAATAEDIDLTTQLTLLRRTVGRFLHP